MQARQPSSDLTALMDELEATLRAAVDVSQALLGHMRSLSERVQRLQEYSGPIREAVEAVRAFEVAAPPPAASPAPRGAAPGPLGVLFIEVERSDGPLDLRAVDRPVSRHPDVADVALLDYDGRRARFKIWTRSPAGIPGLRDALEGSIRESLAASQGSVKVQVQASAA